MPKQRSLLLTATLFSLSALMAGCTASDTPSTDQENKTYRFTLLQINDHFDSRHEASEPSPHEKPGEHSNRKVVIERIRAEVELAGGRTLLLSVGDFASPPVEQNRAQALAKIEEMNQLGLDAMAVGHQEFEMPEEALREQQQHANFPFLSANVYSADSGHPLFDAYKLFNLDGLSLAVIGLTPGPRNNLVNQPFAQGIDFRSPVFTAMNMVPQLRDQADIVIATSNFGHYRSEESGTENEGNELTLAQEVEGIDIILSGRPKGIPPKNHVNTTWIFRTQGGGREISRTDFEFTNGELRLTDYQLIPVDN